MATTCNMSDELLTESMWIGFPCSPCKKGGIIVEASKYCEECGENMCDGCLRFHQRFAATSDHTVSVISKTLVPKERITEVTIPTYSTSSPYEITGMCFVRRGEKLALLLTERYSLFVKIMDMNSNKVVSSVSIQSEPYGVKHLPESDKLAVTSLDTQEIVFIEIDDELNLRIIQRVKIPQSCRGLDVISGPFNDNIVLVSGGHKHDTNKGSVNIYGVVNNPDGIQLFPLKKFQLQSFRPNLKSYQTLYPKNVTIDSLRKKIYVSDGRGVLVLDFAGKSQGTFSDPKLDRSRGICCDLDGNVYVGGEMSANILKFDCHGNLIGEIADKRVGLKSPFSMCFDSSTKTLVIGSQNENVIRILRL
ncbi:hypothetical protein ACF0H5_005261 [Mactra antiquata]